MGKKPLIIIGVVVLSVAIGVFYLVSSNGNQQTPQAPVSTQPNSSLEGSDASPVAQNPAAQGQYVDYSSEAFSSASGKRILYFHAPWCPQCRDLDASIKKGPIPQNVTIFKTDFDTSQELRKKYGVAQQTTVVLVDSNGSQLKKFVAYDEPSLNTVVNNLLK